MILFNADSSMTYLMFFKLNYIEFKRQGKKQSKKKILRLMLQDLYDRWLSFFCISYCLAKGISSGKLTLDNLDQYFARFAYLILTEICFKWIKDIVLIKVSGSGENGSYINEVTKELVFLNDSCKFNYLKGKKPEEYDIQKAVDPKYVEFVLNYEWKILTTDNFGLIERFKGLIDYENLITIEMEISVTIIIAELYLFLKVLGILKINFFCVFGLLGGLSALVAIVVFSESLSCRIQNFLVSKGANFSSNAKPEIKTHHKHS